MIYFIIIRAYKVKKKNKGTIKLIVAVHQPPYLIWIGYFDKMIKADVSCYLNNVQYKKNEWQNRNRNEWPCTSCRTIHCIWTKGC